METSKILKVQTNLEEPWQLPVINIIWKNKRKFYGEARVKIVSDVFNVGCICLILVALVFWKMNQLVVGYTCGCLAILGIIINMMLFQLRDKYHYNMLCDTIKNLSLKNNIKEYQFDERCITIMENLECRRIEWRNVCGYSREEGWLLMSLLEETRAKTFFILIHEEKLEKEDKQLLNFFLENKVKQKNIDWKKYRF